MEFRRKQRGDGCVLQTPHQSNTHFGACPFLAGNEGPFGFPCWPPYVAVLLLRTPLRRVFVRKGNQGPPPICGVPLFRDSTRIHPTTAPNVPMAYHFLFSCLVGWRCEARTRHSQGLQQDPGGHREVEHRADRMGGEPAEPRGEGGAIGG